MAKKKHPNALEAHSGDDNDLALRINYRSILAGKKAPDFFLHVTADGREVRFSARPEREISVLRIWLIAGNEVTQVEPIAPSTFGVWPSAELFQLTEKRAYPLPRGKNWQPCTYYEPDSGGKPVERTNWGMWRRPVNGVES